MRKVFHVKRSVKTLYLKGFFVFLVMMLVASCIKPLHTIEIQDYILMDNGKEVLGQEKGLTAFIFENNQKKMPFVQFVSEKYNIGTFTNISYWVTVDGHRLKVFVYENDELEKYFDTSQFMVTNVEPDSNIIGSKAKFIAISVINEQNEDCLEENSLYRMVTVEYLKKLKDEFNKS